MRKESQEFCCNLKKTPISFSLFVAWLILEVKKQSFVKNN